MKKSKVGAVSRLKNRESIEDIISRSTGVLVRFLPFVVSISCTVIILLSQKSEISTWILSTSLILKDQIEFSLRIGDEFQIKRLLDSVDDDSFAGVSLFKFRKSDVQQKIYGKYTLPCETNHLAKSGFCIDKWKITYYKNSEINVATNYRFRLHLVRNIDPVPICLVFILSFMILYSTIRLYIVYFTYVVKHKITNPIGKIICDLDSNGLTNIRIFGSSSRWEIREIYLLKKNLIQAGKRMIAAIEMEKENEKLSIVATTARMLGHDLRMPLELFRRALNENSVKKDLRKEYHSALNRVNTMIEALKNSDESRIIKKSYGQLKLTELGNEVSAGLETKISYLGIENPWIYADISKLERLVLNILRNSVEVGADEISIFFRKDGSTSFLSIKDNGPGIPIENYSKIFEIGVTFGKDGGTGLGLAYCRDVARGHGGDIIYNRIEGLSEFLIELPDTVLDKNLKINSTEFRNSITSATLSNLKFQILLHMQDARLQQEISSLLKGIPVTTDLNEAIHSAAVITDRMSMFVKNPRYGVSLLIVGKNDTAESFIIKNRRTIDRVKGLKKKFIHVS